MPKGAAALSCWSKAKAGELLDRPRCNDQGVDAGSIEHEVQRRFGNALPLDVGGLPQLFDRGEAFAIEVASIDVARVRETAAARRLLV